VIVVAVKQAFQHCPKALVRSDPAWRDFLGEQPQAATDQTHIQPAFGAMDCMVEFAADSPLEGAGFITARPGFTFRATSSAEATCRVMDRD
jgi:hypothetical protein